MPASMYRKLNMKKKNKKDARTKMSSGGQFSMKKVKSLRKQLSDFGKG